MDDLNFDSLEQHITDCNLELEKLEPGTEDYTKVEENLDKLYRLQEDIRSSRATSLNEENKTKMLQKIENKKMFIDIGKFGLTTVLYLGIVATATMLETEKHEIRTLSISKYVDKILPNFRLF